MATVILNCTNCSKDFSKSSHEISRRKAKTKCSSDNWFCSRSCAVSHSNKGRLPNPPKPQHGNDYSRKWDEHLSWYIKRMSSDGRSKCLMECSKQDMHDHIKEIWNGRCSVTGVPILRRDHSGNVDTNNPFYIASIDRIDNEKPYDIGNVRWTSVAINLARQQAAASDFDEHFREFAEAIALG